MRKFLIAPLAALAAATAAETTTILDLSLPEFPSSPSVNANPGATEVIQLAKSTPEVRTFLVLENGHVVAEYVREDVDPSAPTQLWSATRTWVGLALGMMIQDGLLGIDESLGEIFEDAAIWQNITDAEFRRAVTVQELLTMTSGLVDPPDWFKGGWWGKGGSLGGATLADALQTPQVKFSKTFSYLSGCNILSYIIPQRTEYATPREYLAAKVFPALGISNAQIDWWQSEDGIEYASHGLSMTAMQMAKLGQLYLQGGKSSEINQLINKDWVAESTSHKRGDALYAYLWWILWGSLSRVGQPELETFFCAQGMGGQDVCVSPQSGRVAVQQRDFKMNEEFEPLVDSRWGIIGLALTPESDFGPLEGHTTGFERNNDGFGSIPPFSSGASLLVNSVCLISGSWIILVAVMM